MNTTALIDQFSLVGRGHYITPIRPFGLFTISSSEYITVDLGNSANYELSILAKQPAKDLTVLHTITVNEAHITDLLFLSFQAANQQLDYLDEAKVNAHYEEYINEIDHHEWPSEQAKLSFAAQLKSDHHKSQQAYFKSFINRLDPEAQDYSSRGACLIINELNKSFRSIIKALQIALNDGLSVFYTAYKELIERIELNSQFDVSEEEFLEHCIKQHDNKVFLSSTWVEPIIEALWLGDLKAYASKTPALQESIVDRIAYELFVHKPEITVNNHLWVDFDEGNLTAGLSPSVVDKVLAQHNQGIIIDLLKLFTTLWNEHPQIQQNKSFEVVDRWDGLARMLNERYGLSINGNNRQSIINSCRLLESLRWGTSWESHRKLLTFSGLKDEELVITYLSGFYKPLIDHERLIPILDHPKGIGRSRPFYNRFGLAIGSWLVNHSVEYYRNDGLGVLLDDAAYNYFRNRVGFRRKSDVEKAIETFTHENQFMTLNDGLLGLGPNNKEGERLILEGAKRSIKGRRNGLSSAEKRAKRLN